MTDRATRKATEVLRRLAEDFREVLRQIEECRRVPGGHGRGGPPENPARGR